MRKRKKFKKKKEHLEKTNLRDGVINYSPNLCEGKFTNACSWKLMQKWRWHQTKHENDGDTKPNMKNKYFDKVLVNIYIINYVRFPPLNPKQVYLINYIWTLKQSTYKVQRTCTNITWYILKM